MAQTRRSLRERLDADLQALGSLTTEDALRTRCHELHARYPEHLLLDALISHLDSSNSQLRGGLGLLAQLLPRDRTVQALLRVVPNRHLSATARLSAVTILQDYLERPVQSQFVADIADTDAVVLASMREAFAARAQYPGVLLEYTQQFAELAPSHQTYVLGLLSQIPPADAAELLRIMAYHRTGQVAATALEHLGAMAGAEAEQALYVLSQTLFLDPGPRQTALTQLRRKRFRGASLFTPPPRPHELHAMPLGFTPRGGLLVHFAIPATSCHVLMEYDRHMGIRDMQRIAETRSLPEVKKLGGLSNSHPIVAAADPKGTHFAFFQWHLSWTLAQVTRVAPDQPYPEGFQILAPLLWSWQLPDVSSAMLALFETAANPATLLPIDLAHAVAQTDLCQELPQSARDWLWHQTDVDVTADTHLSDLPGSAIDPVDPMYQYWIWWLQTAAAIHRQTDDHAGSTHLAQAAALLATDHQGAASFFQALKQHLLSDHTHQAT